MKKPQLDCRGFYNMGLGGEQRYVLDSKDIFCF